MLLKRLKFWLKSKFSKKEDWAPFKGQGAFGIPLKRQIDKRTHFQPGEQYQVGSARATVHADEESMLKALALTEYTRMKKHDKLTQRGIDLMLMTPEELEQLKLNEFFASRKKKKYLFQYLTDLFSTSIEKEATPGPLPKAEEPAKEEVKAVVNEEELVK